jgi:Methyltransferase domain
MLGSGPERAAELRTRPGHLLELGIYQTDPVPEEGAKLLDPPSTSVVRQRQDAHDQPLVPINLEMLRRRGFRLGDAAGVLDFCASLGRHVREFRANGFDTWGLDVRTSSLATATSNHKNDSWIRLYAPWDREPTPFPDNNFDLIVSTSTFERVLDFDLALSEIAGMPSLARRRKGSTGSSSVLDVITPRPRSC